MAASRSDIADAYRALGVAPGGLWAVISDLAAFARVDTGGDTGPDAEAALHYDVLRELAGPDGTLVFPTFTYQRQATGGDFVLEETPSETGVLTEYARRRPDALRSLHPIFSFAAIGPRAAELTRGLVRHSYGWDSVTHRLVQADAQVLSIGRSPHRGGFFLHLAEVFTGVPYRYTKEVAIQARAEGRPVRGPFFHFVKYAGSDIVWDTNRVVERMQAAGLVDSRDVDGRVVWRYSARGMFDTASALLLRNPFALLAAPPATAPWAR